jgi:hypothetical protein
MSCVNLHYRIHIEKRFEGARIKLLLLLDATSRSSLKNSNPYYAPVGAGPPIVGNQTFRVIRDEYHAVSEPSIKIH